MIEFALYAARRLVCLSAGYVTLLSCPLLAGPVDLLVSGYGSSNVVRFDGTSGALLGEFIPSGAGGLNGTWDVTLGPLGNVYVASSGSDSILAYASDSGEFIGVFASGGGLRSPVGAVFGPDNNLYVSTAAANSGILRFDGQTGAFLDVFTSGTQIATARGLTFGPDGDVYVSDILRHSVLRYDGTSGIFRDFFVDSNAGGLRFPGDLQFGPDGNLYVASRDTDSVLRYDGTTGAFIDAFATGSSLRDPIGLDFGPDGNLYVSNISGTNRVVRFDGVSGAFIDVFAVGGPLASPTFITFVPEPQTALLALAAGVFLIRRRRSGV